MLYVTADIFSGRPNPSWMVTDEEEVKTTLKELANARDLLVDAPPTEAGLGFRGVMTVVEVVGKKVSLTEPPENLVFLE